MSNSEYDVVIGLEVHVQLKTETKLFCDCKNEFAAAPNQNTCPICSGYPGVLPVPNKRALELGIRAGLMLECEIQAESKFDRKHYFYPDLPKGYQITQYDRPFALGGKVLLDSGKKACLERIHWEEDAGKNIHRKGYSIVDLNRAGVPLIEIVGRPDLTSPAEAHDFLVNLRRALRYAGVSDCDMEKGSLRCDANISLRPKGQKELGTKVEIKNLNSFSMVEHALTHEIERQSEVLTKGERLVQETRLWDEEKGETRSMRRKEAADDYRYFMEPDIPEIRFSDARIRELGGTLPQSHWQKKKRYERELALSPYDAALLSSELEIALYFEEVLTQQGDAKLAANWVMTEVLRAQKELECPLGTFPIRPVRLGELLALVAAGTVSHSGAKKIFQALLTGDESPAQALDRMGLAQISDPAELEPIVKQVIASSEKAVADFKKGKSKALDAMKGKVMQLTRGRANPQVVSDLLSREIGVRQDFPG